MANGYRTLSQHLNDLKKENFSLKLRIYFLEERVQQKGEGSRDDVYRRNIELKVEVESLKRELQEKQQALDNKWVAAENQTTRSQAALRQQYEERQRESEHVYELLENKIQLLQEEARLARSEAEQATALAKAEAERCRELAGKLKEAARTKEEDRSDDGCGTMAQRWVPRTCPLYVASLCPVPILGDYQGAGAVQGREAVGIQGGGGVTPRRESWAVGNGEHP
uniref:Centrosomin N-terminal motif 1 domain-containing protein n=1 Tax=Aquila chrysaetos chrysaetos TaxID=223781 RepID=A0A663FGI9_AQUCH